METTTSVSLGKEVEKELLVAKKEVMMDYWVSENSVQRTIAPIRSILRAAFWYIVSYEIDNIIHKSSNNTSIPAFLAVRSVVCGKTSMKLSRNFFASQVFFSCYEGIDFFVEGLHNTWLEKQDWLRAYGGRFRPYFLGLGHAFFEYLSSRGTICSQFYVQLSLDFFSRFWFLLSDSRFKLASSKLCWWDRIWSLHVL